MTDDRFIEHQRKAGSAKTPKKAQSSRQNLPNGGGRPLGAKNKNSKPCLGAPKCWAKDGGEVVHHWSCPVASRERTRERRAKAKEKNEDA